jgi:membrane-associated protease RseP (regulator of RpoE activity)
MGKEVANCAVGECTYTERVAFPVDEEVLRRLAAANGPGDAAIWTYTLSAKSGPDFRGELSSAEIAGLLAKADELINAPPAAKPRIADEVLKFDLGVAGMQVAATADQTNRAGILITAVDRGSVAQRSGIIVGDILYEFGGHPIKALADLQSAAAAGAANPGVAIRLFRGTDRMSLAAQF